MSTSPVKITKYRPPTIQPDSEYTRELDRTLDKFFAELEELLKTYLTSDALNPVVATLTVDTLNGLVMATAGLFDQVSLESPLSLSSGVLKILNQNAVTVITGNYTILSTDRVIVCNSSGDLTVTLPHPISSSGRHHIIKNIGTGVVTIDGNGTDTIDGELTQALNQWDAVELMAYASGKWAIV